MRSRWTRFLPGFPAILLVPVVLCVWASLCTSARQNPGYEPTYDFEASRVGKFPFAWKGERGVPFSFLGTKFEVCYPRGSQPYRSRVYGFKAIPFLADLAIALATAYVVALAVDVVILHPIRAARMMEHGRGEGR